MSIASASPVAEGSRSVAPSVVRRQLSAPEMSEVHVRRRGPNPSPQAVATQWLAAEHLSRRSVPVDCAHLSGLSRAASLDARASPAEALMPKTFGLPWRPHPPVLRHDLPLQAAACALHDARGALDRSGCVAELLSLRARAHQGAPLSGSMLTRFTRTSHNNALRLLLDRAYFADLLPALYAARSSIHIAVLTLDDSPIGRAVTTLLMEKKRHNPDLQVRIIFDNFGSQARLPWSPQLAMARRLRRAGIEVVVNNLVTSGLEHRKMVVIDGKLGYFGGSCLGHEYYGSTTYWRRFAALARARPEDVPAVFRRKYDPTCQPRSDLCTLDDQPDMPQFHDFAMRCEGELVHFLQAAFLQSWLLHRQPLDRALDDAALAARYFPPVRCAGSLPTKLVNSVPGGNSEIGPTLLEVVAAAEHTLDLTFAYILVPQFVDVLAAAARRGVKIRLLVTGEAHMDIPPAYYALRAHYPRLFAAGNIEIYEFCQYTHIKLMVADHRLVLASTGNPEWDSWERAFDETAVVDSAALAKIVEDRVFAPDMSPAWATRATPEQLEQLPPAARAKTRLCRWLFDTFFCVRKPATVA